MEYNIFYFSYEDDRIIKNIREIIHTEIDLRTINDMQVGIFLVIVENGRKMFALTFSILSMNFHIIFM